MTAALLQRVDASKEGLQATLIVRDPDSGRMFVNFNQDILQLISESKWLLRLRVEVPDSAMMVVHQVCYVGYLKVTVQANTCLGGEV